MDYITEATKRVLPTGCQVFQIFQFSDDEKEHVAALLAASDLPNNAVVLDVGCGIGAVPKIMQEIRPDLRFDLLNDNEFQLSLCPADMDKILGDVHNIDLELGKYDAVFLHYVLGYLDLDRVFPKLFEAIKPGGEIQIYDMVGFHPAMKRTLGYDTYPPALIEYKLEQAGFEPVKTDLLPSMRTGNFEKILALETDEAAILCRMILAQMQPALVRFRKPSQTS